MADQQSPGMKIGEEKSGSAVITASTTGIGGLLVQTERGPDNDPVLIGGLPEYDVIFGPTDYLGTHGRTHVKEFFDEGGSALYVCRLLHSDAVAASSQLQDTGPASTCLLTASYKGASSLRLTRKCTQTDTLIGTTGAIAASAQTSAVLSSVDRAFVGATLNIKDHTTPANHVRAVITRIDVGTKTVYFASATPSGAITAGDVYLEEWILAIYRDGQFIRGYSEMSMDATAGRRYFMNIINTGDPADPITVTNNGLAASVTVDNRPATDANPVAFTGGQDGTAVAAVDVTGDETARTGLHAFDLIDDVNQIAAPGWQVAAVQQAILNWCAARKESGRPCHGLLASNEPQTTAQVKTHVMETANLYGTDSSFFMPGIYITHPETGVKTAIDPTAAIMGMFNRNDQRRGVQKAPAGTPDGQLVTALGPTRKISQTEYDSVYLPARVNAIMTKKGRGTVVFGCTTLGTGDFRTIPVRRTFNFFEMSIYKGLDWVVFEPNNPTTWAAVRKSIGTFCLRQWAAGKLQGAKASEAFYIICDESLNPPSAQKAGKLRWKLGLAVSDPSEFVEGTFARDTRALDAELSASGIR